MVQIISNRAQKVETPRRTLQRGHMPHARPRRPPVARVATETPTASRLVFPGAVAGEQYPRYAKSVWAQAQRWLVKHWPTAIVGAATALDVRVKLRAIAAREIRRHLYAEEEQLLSEIVHGAWTSAARDHEA